MDLKQYADDAFKTVSETGTITLDNHHMLFGMVTEVAECVDAFKKDLAYNKPVDWINVQEEIGDLMWYISNFCTFNDFDLEKILDQNIAKLKARYPNQFESDKAINRDLEKERKILEELGYQPVQLEIQDLDISQS